MLILFEMRYKEKDHAIRTISGMSYWQAFLIGLIQSLSIVPGVSRAGATIIGGLLAGLDRKTIVEFSFLLAVPTMMVATGYDLFKNGYAFSSEDIKALILVLNKLVDKGNTVIVIEHNLDVVKVADYIIDLGPEGGRKGGNLVAAGTPEELSGIQQSFTGQFLRKELGK